MAGEPDPAILDAGTYARGCTRYGESGEGDAALRAAGDGEMGEQTSEVLRGTSLPFVDVFQVGVAVQAVFVEPQQAAGFLVADAALADGGLDVAAEAWRAGASALNCT